jgi:APA family basic amino acid/polyamine antiporter
VTESTAPKPVLGLFDVTMIVMGCIIGAGCFANPAAVAAEVRTSGWILAVWGLGGLIALTGALVFAELAAMFPRCGGQYVFVREPFGRFPAFMFGWLLLAAIVSNAIAWVGRVFASHLSLVIDSARDAEAGAGLTALGDGVRTLLAPLTNGLSAVCGWPGDLGPSLTLGEKTVAFLLIAGFAWLNVRGLRLGATVQNVAMVAKIAGIVAVVALGGWWWATGGAPAGAVAPPDGSAGGGAERAAAAGTIAAAATTGLSLKAFNAALFKAMFTYGGWQNVAAVGGEVKNARRTLPLGILLGTVGVVTLYLSLNGALLAVLGADGLAATRTPTADAAGRVIPHGELFVAALVMTSTFAITQALLMVTPRIYCEMARDGLFPAAIGRLHPRFGTPALAIGLQAAAAAVHLMLGDLLDLLDMTTFFDWLGFTLCALGLFVLRVRRPDLPRPYRAWGYPWIPGLFLALSIWVFGFHFVAAEPLALQRSAWVFGLGLVIYIIFERRRRAEGSVSSRP